MRKPPTGKSLAEINPELANEWHPHLNDVLTPYDITANSGKKVWWKCNKGPDHEWEAIVGNRSKGSGCSICSGYKVVSSNCLQTTHPELAAEWHPGNNETINPCDIHAGSNKKVWWKCNKGPDHEWEAVIDTRSRGSGCPICAGRIVVKSNALTTTHPELIKEWHPSKNGAISPHKIHAGSSKRVWWKCDKGEDHEWSTVVYSRTTLGTGCPFCNGKKVSITNSLLALRPDLVDEWHKSKNKNLRPDMVTVGSSKKVWWMCLANTKHNWSTSVAKRTDPKKPTNCPYCSNQLTDAENSILTTHPAIAAQIHPTKNIGQILHKTNAGSNKKIWWKCDKGPDHEWQYRIADRTRKGHGCPMCSGNQLSITNCLSSVSPNLSKEWHPTKNGLLKPNEVTWSSGKSVWWKCNKGPDHEWKSKISNRQNGRGCPFCTLTPQSRQELIILFELSSFFSIDPKGFKINIDNKLWSIDIYIAELNLGIEFDGSHWHKDKRDLDKLKTKQLEGVGFNILRIREEPLKKIFETDIISKKPYNGKEITNNVLKHIIANYNISNSRLDKLKKYISKKTLQNQEALDEYIEKILIEKAENKKNKKSQYNNGYK